MSVTDPLAEQYRAILEVSESIAAHRDLAELFRALAQRLPQVLTFSSLVLGLHDPNKDVMRLHVLEDPRPMPVSLGIEFPVEDVPGGWVWQRQQPLICVDLEQETRFPRVMPMILGAGIRSLCIVPLTTARHRLGAMGVGSLEPNHYGQAEVDFLQQVAKQVAVAVENTLNFERAQKAEQSLTRQLERERLMLEINNAVVSHLELPKLLTAVSACLRQVIPHDVAGFCVYDAETNRLLAYSLDFTSNQEFRGIDESIPLEGTPEGLAFTSQKTVLIKNLSLAEFPAEIIQRGKAAGVKSGCAVPLIAHGRVLGTLSVVSLRESAFSEDDAELLGNIGSQLAIAFENVLAYQEISTLKDKLNKEKFYLEDEIRSELNFEEIIGESPAIKQVLKQVGIVAPTDSTVLILGETGTGKELLARAIHDRSKWRERTFVKLNCAAIPTGLLESELFGHEKGAFTGAIATKVGRFELADGGTLFLDEVGDIPSELQSKLLRVLQEQEFERLGSTRTIKVSVRLLAATNRDLLEMVENKQFRSDLYYRLNVFPIESPALRDRTGDIPLLIRYFTQRFSRQMEKRIERIPSDTMDALCRYQWPGNIRELENLVERAVILSEGAELNISLGEVKVPMREQSRGTVQTVTTLKHAEREHIINALRQTDWVIAGSSGAAALLGMKRSTLQSKMQKLGISRHS